MSKANTLASIVATACLSASGASAQGVYPFDLGKKNPKAMQAWRSIVPRDLRSNAWIRDFRGTAGTADDGTIAGKPAYFGTVCLPHNCSSDYVVYLIARDGSAAAGAVVSPAQDIPRRFFGANDAETKRVLSEALDAVTK